MFFLTIFIDYIKWHYTCALISYIRVYKNFWWFIVQFFSIPQLTSSLFSPYKRITEKRVSGFDIEAWFSYILINLMSRIIGFIIRLTIILLGIICLISFSLLALFGYAVWIIAPILLVVCLLIGIYLIS